MAAKVLVPAFTRKPDGRSVESRISRRGKRVGEPLTWEDYMEQLAQAQITPTPVSVRSWAWDERLGRAVPVPPVAPPPSQPPPSGWAAQLGRLARRLPGAPVLEQFALGVEAAAPRQLGFRPEEARARGAGPAFTVGQLAAGFGGLFPSRTPEELAREPGWAQAMMAIPPAGWIKPALVGLPSLAEAGLAAQAARRGAGLAVGQVAPRVGLKALGVPEVAGGMVPKARAAALRRNILQEAGDILRKDIPYEDKLNELKDIRAALEQDINIKGLLQKGLRIPAKEKAFYRSKLTTTLTGPELNIQWKNLDDLIGQVEAMSPEQLAALKPRPPTPMPAVPEQLTLTGERVAKFPGPGPVVQQPLAPEVMAPATLRVPPTMAGVMTEARWAGTSITERVVLAERAGLSGRVGSKDWAYLSKPEQTAIETAFSGTKPPSPIAPEAAPAAAKEPWQMTRAEWGKQPTTEGERLGFFPRHKDIVRNALAEGKPVPPEVLADYPDLALTAPAKIQPAAPPIEAVAPRAAAPRAEVPPIPKGLEPLAEEARKYATAKEFSLAYSAKNMHGRYWHITDDLNFNIRKISPRDMSSLAGEGTGEVGLMVSSNPEHWVETFPARKYLVEIDLSKAIPGRDYVISSRGFGQEIFVSNLEAAQVKKIFTIQEGLKEYNRYFGLLQKTMTSPDAGEAFWRRAQVPLAAKVPVSKAAKPPSPIAPEAPIAQAAEPQIPPAVARAAKPPTQAVPLLAAPPPVAPSKVILRLSIRSTQREGGGFLITGRDTKNRQVRVFAKTLGEAKQARDRLKQGLEPFIGTEAEAQVRALSKAERRYRAALKRGEPGVIERARTELEQVQARPTAGPPPTEPPKLPPKMMPNGTEVPPPEFEAARNKLVSLLQGAARKGSKEIEQARAAERARRFAISRTATEEALAAGRSPLPGIRAAQRGEMPIAELALPDRLTPEEVAVLRDRIYKTLGPELDWTSANIEESLTRLATEGKIPTGAEMAWMEEIFGPELIEALRSLRTRGAKIGEVLLEIWNLPRAVLASFDDSMVLRQGLHLLAEGTAAARALKAHVRALTKIGADGINATIRANPWFNHGRAHGLDMTLPGMGRGIGGREEVFFGAGLARKLPIVGKGVEISERIATAYLNKLRIETYAAHAEELTRMGAGYDAFRELAENINILSGRASLGRLQPIAPYVNGMFFSARLNWAAAQRPFRILRQVPQLGTPEGRHLAKMLAKDVYGIWAAIGGMLGLGAAAGVIAVQLDSRSSDFGKARIGSVRLDPWAGQQQLAVLVARIISGQTKATTTGGVRPADPVPVLARFLESKMHPALSQLIAVRRGETYVGEDLTVKEYAKMWAPLFIQDIQEIAATTSPGVAIPLGLGGFFGVSVYNIPQQEGAKPTGLQRSPWSLLEAQAGPARSGLWERLEAQAGAAR